MSTTFVKKSTGVEIAVHSLGGNGPLLIFAPANGFHGRCYEPLVRSSPINYGLPRGSFGHLHGPSTLTSCLSGNIRVAGILFGGPLPMCGC